MNNTLRALDFLASLHLTIFERAANFEFFSQSTGRPKTAICGVSEKIQTAHLSNTLRGLDFLASLHLAIFERAANFEFLASQLKLSESKYFLNFCPSSCPGLMRRHFSTAPSASATIPPCT